MDVENEKKLAAENVKSLLKMVDEKSKEYADRVDNKSAIEAFYTMMIFSLFDALPDGPKTFVLKQLMIQRFKRNH